MLVGELTCWRDQRSGQVRTWKDNDLARGTHCLERADIRTSQDIEIKQASKGHLQTGEGRGYNQSEHGKKASHLKPVRGTHKLKRVEVRTGQEMVRK